MDNFEARQRCKACGQLKADMYPEPVVLAEDGSVVEVCVECQSSLPCTPLSRWEATSNAMIF